MAKSLRRFKRDKVLQAELVQDLERDDLQPAVMIDNSPSIGVQPAKLLDTLEKSGYAKFAEALRQLQITQGRDELDPLCQRIAKIEAHIDKLLDFGHPIDPAELGKLLNMAIAAYQARAKALLLPYGSVSPRTALQGTRGKQGPIQVAIGIGQGVVPRPKQ